MSLFRRRYINNRGGYVFSWPSEGATTEFLEVEPMLRYLGLILESRWNFREHFSRLALRLMSAATGLRRLMPNLGGAKEGSSCLYLSMNITG